MEKLFYEPKNKLFGWNVHTWSENKKTEYSHSKERIDIFLEDGYIYLLNNKIVHFVDRFPSVLLFKEFQKQYNNLKEARQRLLLSLEDRIDEILPNRSNFLYHEIPIGEYLNLEFTLSRDK